MDTTSVYTPLPAGATAVNGTGILDEEDYIINMPFLWTAASTIQLDKFNLSLITFGFFNNLAQSDPMTGVTFKDADFIDRGAIDSVASRSAIRYLTVGTAPNRIFKIGIANAWFFEELNPYGTLNDSVNVQAWFYEGKSHYRTALWPLPSIPL